MGAPSRVLVARHGETEWNEEGRIQGWAPVGLNDRGHRQAAALAEHLAETYDVDHVVASDRVRTRETARHMAEAGLPPAEFTSGWRERDFGVFQGLLARELFERYPEFDATRGVHGVKARPEGGESFLDLHERVATAWEAVLNLDHETVLVVTHGGPLHVVHGLVTGEDLVTALTKHRHDNCALSVFDVDGTATVVSENECAWTR